MFCFESTFKVSSRQDDPVKQKPLINRQQIPQFKTHKVLNVGSAATSLSEVLNRVGAGERRSGGRAADARIHYPDIP